MISVANPSNHPYVGWVDFVVPKEEYVGGEWGFGTGKTDPWYIGRPIGRHGFLAHAYVHLAPGQKLTLQTWLQENTKWPFPSDLSGWLMDEPAKAAPGILVGATHPHTGQVEDLQLENLEIHTVSMNAVETVVRLRSRLRFADGTITPLFYRCYVYLKAGQDHADFDWQLVHSDASSSYLGFDAHNIRLISGEQHSIDFGSRLSVKPPRWNPNGFWESVLREGVTGLGDGVRFSVTGAVYGMPKGGEIDPDGRDKARIETMLARREMPPVAAETGWRKWLALGVIPENPFTVADPEAQVDQEFKQFVDYLKLPADYFDQRPLGLTKTPGQTGDQEDFGCAKGTAIISADNPLGIFKMLFSVSDHLRPTAYYERSMEPVTKSGHPNWVTWSMRTHASGSDRLGKDINGFIPSYGWQGADDQHYSFLNTQACYALTGRLWLRDLLVERLEPTLARYADGSGRAFGRVFHMLANDLMLLDDPRIVPHLQAVMQNKGLNDFIANAPGKYKAWQRATDPRVLVDSAGRPVEAMVIWQHGLMAIGLRALDLVLQGQSPEVRSALSAACRVVVEAGFFRRKSDGRWTVADAVAYNNGNGVPETEYEDGRVLGKVYTSGWFWEWNIGAVQIMQTLLSESETDGDAALIDKCRAILFQSGRPADRRSAEWRAIR